MIDAHGKRIQVGWSAYEDLWVEAALTLQPDERKKAYSDIAYMSGRSYDAVRQRAQNLYNAKMERVRAISRAWLQDHNQKVYEARSKRPPEPSLIKPSLAMMMAGRATYSPTTGMR